MTITLETGEEITTEATLIAPRFGGWFLRTPDSLECPVINIARFKDQSGEFIRIQGSSRLARLVSKGTVSLYEKHRADTLILEPSDAFSGEPAGYISLNGSPAIIASYENVSTMLGDNARSRHCLSNFRTWQYIKVGSGALAAGLFTASLCNMEAGETPIASLISGVLCAGIALLAHTNQQGALRDAITEYNRPGY